MDGHDASQGMRFMKILITGSDGFSGSHYLIRARNEGHQVLGVDVNPWFKPEGCEIQKLDIRDVEGCEKVCRRFAPDAIIHTARAPGSLGMVEKDRVPVYQINVNGTWNLAQYAEESGATFVFLTTDWVFNGRQALGEKYREEDEPCPINYYGVTKYISEQMVRSLKTRWLILRPAHIYGLHAVMTEGPEKKGMDILDKTLWMNIARPLKQKKAIRIPDNMYQTPVLVNHLVETTYKLLSRELKGIFHIVDRDCVSRYRVTTTVLEALGFETALIEKGTIDDFGHSQGLPPDFFGILPANSCLDVSKIEAALEERMLSFEEGIARMKDRLNR